MAGQTPQRANLLQDTLDVLVLRTLLYSPTYGHQIGKHIQRTTNDFSSGAARIALSRIAPAGAKTVGHVQVGDGPRPQPGVQVLPLTENGRKHLVFEESEWKQMAEAVAGVMWPAAEES